MVANAAQYDTDARISFNRSAFGHNDKVSESGLAIWSPLTALETRLLVNRDLLQRNGNNVDAMLALYLLASGDVRTNAEFKAVWSELTQWIQKIRPQIAALPDQKAQAKALFTAMHSRFFVTNTSRTSVPSGYDPDQSRLSAIFENQQYNCISSSLLYVLLSESFDIKAMGVVIPSHTFVQLDLDNGNKVEVETTIAGGFDVVHNQAYYESQAKELSQNLQLPPATWDDYRHRSIISPLALGLLDMGSQHTSPQRMDYSDRMRLAEIRAALAPANVDAQFNRVYYYAREITYLDTSQDYVTLARLLRTIEPWLSARSLHEFDHPDWQRAIASLKVEQAYALIKVKRDADGLKLSRQLLASLPTSIEDYDKLSASLYANIAQFVADAAKLGQFKTARRAVAGFEQPCLDDNNCRTGLAILYSRWTESYWQQKDWRSVIRVIKEYLALDPKAKDAYQFKQNMEAAYLNLARSYALGGSKSKYKQVLQDCVANVKPAVRCQAALQTINTQGTL